MAVYYIGTYDIVDADEFQKYPPLVLALLPEVRRRGAGLGHRGHVVEGSRRTMNAIIRFPSREAALGLYHDPGVSRGQAHPPESTRNVSMVLVNEFKAGARPEPATIAGSAHLPARLRCQTCDAGRPL